MNTNEPLERRPSSFRCRQLLQSVRYECVNKVKRLALKKRALDQLLKAIYHVPIPVVSLLKYHLKYERQVGTLGARITFKLLDIHRPFRE